MTDRKPLCIATLVDEKYQAYVPMFIYCAKKANPDADVRVFLWTQEPTIVHALGVEEIVPVTLDYPHDMPNLTPCLRYIELESQLKPWDNVLLTDVDILHRWEDPGILLQHRTRMDKNGTLCYDNGLTHSNKMSAVHFITPEWWDATRITRTLCGIELKMRTAIEWGYDENLLYRIVKESGLPIRNEHYTAKMHGIHLGRYRKGNRCQPANGDFSQYRELTTDPDFIRIANECGKRLPEIAKEFSLIGREV